MSEKRPDCIGDARIGANEITDFSVYQSRRTLMTGALGLGLSGALLASVGTAATSKAKKPTIAPASLKYQAAGEGYRVKEPQTPFEAVTGYNNFYEFGTSKDDPARYAKALTTRPWTVEVGGVCEAPKIFDIESMLKFPLEERVYRLRCVEGWSMVIPWVGFQLSALIKAVKPLASAKYVAFETLNRPREMFGQRDAILNWPYQEGLRMDEAVHPLTFMALGVYGQILPNQNGAPIRLVVPWKYGFKSAKSIVRITLTERQPATAWNQYAPNEYGFYSNVNPAVDHPRWSQATERRIGELKRRETLPFNGYGEQVASLYTSMDLKKFF